MAIVCSSAGKNFINASPDFKLVGSLMTNTDIVLESTSKVKKVGVTKNKDYLVEYLRNIYGNVDIEFMLPHALPYAYESGRVDAIVLDLADINEKLKGDLRQVNDNYVSEVLVVNKSILKSQHFIEFIKQYNKFTEKYKALDDKTKIFNNNDLDRRLGKTWKLELIKIDLQK